MEAMQSGQQSLIADQLAAIEARERASLDETAASAANLVKQITELSAAYKGLGSAEDAGMGASANLAIAKINSEFADRLNEAAEEMRPLVQAEKTLAIALQNQEASREQQRRAVERETVALQDIEARIAAQKDVIAAEIAAGRDGAAAREALSKMQIEHAAQTSRLKAAEMNAEAALLQHETAVKDARAVRSPSRCMCRSRHPFRTKSARRAAKHGAKRRRKREGIIPK